MTKNSRSEKSNVTCEQMVALLNEDLAREYQAVMPVIVPWKK
jgi:hypothetical protein